MTLVDVISTNSPNFLAQFKSNESINIGFRTLKIIQKDKKKKENLIIFGVEGNIGNVFKVSGKWYDVLMKLENAIVKILPFLGGLNPRNFSSHNTHDSRFLEGRVLSYFPYLNKKIKSKLALMIKIDLE